MSNQSGQVDLKIKGVRGEIKVTLTGNSKDEFVLSADKKIENNKNFGL